MAARRHGRLLFLLCCAVTLGATPALACDPMWLPVGRPDGVAIVVALALAETALDTAAGAVRSRLHPLFARRLDADTSPTRGGQRARLAEWSVGTAAEAGEVILVPWAYREDCRPIEWTGRLDWIAAGTRGAITGWLRPKEGWLDGLPTFDVEMAWREPMWAAGERRWPGGRPAEQLMTPEEFLRFFLELPTFEELDRAPGEAAERLRAWAAEHPSFAARAPAATMLGHAYRMTEKRSPAGVWDVEIDLLDARELPHPTTARTIRGTLRLEAVSTESPHLYAGRASLDLTPLGLGLGSSEVVAEATSDGTRIIFDPTVDHGHVVATVTGSDEMVGTWYLNGRPARASGSIRLTRP